ncbi:hypothetical protein CAEBREN_01441 [Caenorhabditis brenneri]|uniref:BTB domain-containing protein n=1 Tax=Caenorhabditis brenneri TaxID=135651 RepID=G0NC84_CAEBE|nr:hypothetical protein CAEBREN_01441 [Caenorhabditis brenneri]
MDPEEEVELIKFKSEVRPTSEGKHHYGDVLSDHIECSHMTDQHESHVIGYWWLVFDEHLRARMKSWSGELRWYTTNADGERHFEYAFPASTSMLHRLVFDGYDTWKRIKLDYEIDIKITKQPLKKICYDGMFKESEENSTAIEIEDKTVFVNKQLLIDSSDYFRCLFSSEFCDSEKQMINIGLSTFDEFCMLLCTFHPPHEEKIEDHQIEQLLELAERFQMKITTDKICLHLLRNSKIGYNKKLWLAEKYRLPEVINGIFKNFPREHRQHWKFLKFYDLLSEETKRRIDAKD